MEQLRALQGGLNLDDSVEVMDPNDWSYAANIMTGRSYNAKNGEKENVRGTTLISSGSLPLDANSLCIGVIRSIVDDLHYLFFYNTTAAKNCIVKLSAGVLSNVLTWSGLNFSSSKDLRINGGGIVGNLLYFTDDNNEPRCVHVTRYSGGSTPTTEEEILLIKRGPQFAPEIGAIGFATTKSIFDAQFAYQYEYTDGQLSVISPWTLIIREGMEQTIGKITEVPLRVGSDEAIPVLVTKIKFVARKGNNGAAFYIGDIEAPFTPSSYDITYKEQNFGIVDASYLKQFDLVPLLAKTLCVAKSRAWLGNYLEGYDVADSVTLTFTLQDNPFFPQPIGGNFSPNSKFRLGVEFHDDEGRSSGVLDNGWILETDPLVKRNTNRQELAYRITGTPPSWAKYYSLVVTKDINKSYYLQGWNINNAGSEVYVTVAEDGTESFSTTYTSGIKYIRIRLAILNTLGIYYTAKAGDYVLITNDTTNVTYGPLKVVKNTGSYLYVEGTNMGNTTYEYNFQIYTPNAATEDIYYEIGQRREIVAGVLDLVDYVWYGDSINKNIDTNAIVTSNYMPQMSVAPNDGAWNVDAGKPYIKTNLGQVRKQNFFKFSSPFITGTNVNGLSEFNAGDEKNVPAESVFIQKLQPTTKGSIEGDIILAICNSDTFSIYVDEARLSTGDNQSFLIGNPEVVGDVRKQKAGYGTLHPESVHEEDGDVWWYDQYARSFVRYASNGIFPVSEYKAVTYFENQATLNASSDRVVTGYDPFYKAIFTSFRNADTTTKKTIAFSLMKERWVAFFNLLPDAYIVGSNKLYTVVAGSVYSHDSTTFNSFYGVSNNSVIGLSFNDVPDKPKEWKVIQLQTSNNFYTFSGANQVIASGDLTVDITNRHGQATDIRYNEFEVDENMIYGEIKGDSNSTGGVLNGDPIYSNTIQCNVTFSGGTYKQIVMVKAGCELSRGHNL